MLEAKTLTPLSPSAPADIRILRRHYGEHKGEDGHHRHDYELNAVLENKVLLLQFLLQLVLVYAVSLWLLSCHCCGAEARA